MRGQALKVLVGEAVEVYSWQVDERGPLFLASGILQRVQQGALHLGSEAGGEVEQVIDLDLVGLVRRPEVQQVASVPGKVCRFPSRPLGSS